MGERFSCLRWQALHLSKRGNSEVEYEDASAGDPDNGRFAVADGASEASFAGSWARGLVEAFVSTPGKPWQDFTWLTDVRRNWSKEVDQLSLPWYAETKRDEGAYATLVGLALRQPVADKGGTWRAVAVGDACLFHIRQGRLLASFPLTASAEFANNPPLIGSRPGPQDARGGLWEQGHGRWQPNDRFLLMTDALAQWFLRQTETEGNPLAVIDELLGCADPQKAFSDWINRRRDRDGLRNDDVTLLVVDILPAGDTLEESAARDLDSEPVIPDS
jgi:hypothetical protein